MARVLLENVSKYFDDVVAVKNINLEVKDKEFVVLVGPSGCGKTTTLRAIAGLEEISEGKIYIGDRQVNDIPPKDRNIAMVFQNYALYPHMKVYDNMSFGLRISGTPRKEIAKRVNEAAEILGLNNMLDRLPKQLSGGQRQRVALGRAIVRNPQVFLMDEPLSNLDAKLRVQMRAELQKLHNRLQTTIIYVTHDQVEAMTLGQRIAVILNGELQQVEAPLTIYERPDNRFVAGFIGSPPMNFVKGTLSKDYFEDDCFRTKIPKDLLAEVAGYQGKEVIFGIRPEDIWEARSSTWIPDENKESINVKVDFKEVMGSDTYLHISIGKEQLVARAGSDCTAVHGDKLDLVLNLRKIHLFDPINQKAIL